MYVHIATIFREYVVYSLKFSLNPKVLPCASLLVSRG